ncbi:polyphenol oxidase family protein [Sphingomicrobium sp. XHP0239]|uniref:polyphenol oxidase family protein n=1 Tax=Sphingomicrobium maritimum TaxID=3133972 RepID=UPI0031CCCF0F
MSETLTAPPLGDLPHGFFEDGVGMGAAASVLAPEARVARLKQVHSATALVVDAPFDEDSRPEADAMATAIPGLLLAIVTADCAPVLLADREAGVVGAAHAGWRGAIGGVTDACIGAMLSLGAQADRIVAAVGPCIAQKNYEVGPDFPEPFIDEGPANAAFFRDGAAGRPHFDLPGYVAARLKAAGVGRIWLSGEDTYASSRWPSYRRATHEGTSTDLRFYSMIGMATREG